MKHKNKTLRGAMEATNHLLPDPIILTLLTITTFFFSLREGGNYFEVAGGVLGGVEMNEDAESKEDN